MTKEGGSAMYHSHRAAAIDTFQKYTRQRKRPTSLRREKKTDSLRNHIPAVFGGKLKKKKKKKTHEIKKDE
jgi:hypothetical protein